MQYVSDEIQSEYEKWKDGDTIFITSPTGTGKSSFIFNKLLPFSFSSSKKILYLVNRTALKKQLDAELNTNYSDYRHNITIVSYQTIEEEISKEIYSYSVPFQYLDCPNQYVNFYNSNGFNIRKYAKYDYIVCDECHYFMTDSNFNTNTILSYTFVNMHLRDKIRIFMSATIDSVKQVILDDNKNSKFWCTNWLNIHSDVLIDPLQHNHTYEYSLESKLNDVRIHVLRNKTELAEEVVAGTGKWLIFVDNKEYGKELKRNIEAAIKKKSKDYSVVFVTSDYEDDAKAAGEVYTISKNNKQAANVLIATSVLDNGISLNDLTLRNIVIIADTKTQFLQMLGRKRKDGRTINLFILRLQQDHFERRRRIISQFIDIVVKYYNPVYEKIFENFDARKHHDISQASRSINSNEYNRFESTLLLSQNQRIVSSIITNYSEYRAIQSTYLWFNNMLFPNRLAIQNLYNLLSYYTEVINLFESGDENAFLKLQLSWIYNDEEVTSIIDLAFADRLERSRSIIIEKFQAVIDQNEGNEFDGKSIQEKLTEIKDRLRAHFFDVIESAKDRNGYDTYYALIKKNKHPVTKPFIQFLNENCDIPFTLESVKEKRAVLRFQRTNS